MNKKYKNEEYLKTKVGTNNFKPTISLLEKIWPDKKSYTGDDVNKLISALTYNANVNKLKDTIVKQPAIEELNLLEIELQAKNGRKAELQQIIKGR